MNNDDIKRNRHKEFMQFLGMCAAFDIDFSDVFNNSIKEESQELFTDDEKENDKTIKKTYPN